MQCEFSMTAEFDLEEIGDYIARDNPLRALSFVQELRKRCEKLVSFPEAAQIHPELGEGVRLVPYGRYAICYTVHPDIVRIERIISGGRNLPNLFLH
jgi:plasmid stabilization system protein ParE